MSSTSQLSSSPVNIDNTLKLILPKANKIHLKLLAFVQNELNQKKINSEKKFSFSIQNNSEIINEEKNESDKVGEQKSSDTYYNSDDDNNDEEESSEMSCNEECLIDL